MKRIGDERLLCERVIVGTEDAPPLSDAHLSENQPISWREVGDWGETFGWVIVILWPCLHWVNGPAVSDEQSIVRSSLFTVATICALGLSSWRQIQSRISSQ